MVDASKYAGSRFIKLDDVEFAPITTTIVAVEEDSKYDKLNLIFDDGRKLSLNKTNTNRLIKAFGKQTTKWPDREIELVAGDLPYQGNTTRGVVVNPVDGMAQEAAPAKPKVKLKPEPKPGPDLDDEIPY